MVNKSLGVSLVVHTFQMGDVEDPDLYAAEPMWKWQQSDRGKFIMEYAMDTPEWHRQLDQTAYGYQYIITACLKKEDATFFLLKWGNTDG
jgi:hypothetical protein